MRFALEAARLLWTHRRAALNGAIGGAFMAVLGEVLAARVKPLDLQEALHDANA